MKRAIKFMILNALMLALVCGAAGAVFAQNSGGISRQDVDELRSMKRQYDQQRQNISDLKKTLYSGGAVFLVVIAGGMALVVFLMNRVSRKHKEHLDQQIANYHHVHHQEELDHGYRTYHHSHHHDHNQENSHHHGGHHHH